MAYEEVLVSVSLDADSSISQYTGVPGQPGSASPNSGKQYRFVKITAAKTVGVADAAVTGPVIGVLQNKPQKLGSAATVAISGVSKVEAGATVSAGDPLSVDASGFAIAATTGKPIVAFALTGGVAGELVSALLSGPGASPVL